MYLTMSVRKLKNGRWIADVLVGKKPDGSKDRRTKKCKTKGEAERAERILKMRKDARLVSGKITIDDFIRDVFWEQKSDLKPSTISGYKRDIKLRIIPYLGGKYIEDINRNDVQEMISSCATRKVATNARETLSSILGLALDLEMVPRNVASLRYVYPSAEVHPEDYYGVWLSTFEEHMALIEEVKQRRHHPMLLRMVVLGLCFGLRKGEIFGLDWECVNLRERYIRIKQTYASGEGGAYLDEPKTLKGFRYIPITNYAYEIMSTWDLDNRVGPIMRNRYGKRMAPATGKAMMQRFFDKNSDLPRMTLFSLRHSFGTACFDAEMDPAKIKEWMGHEELSTTMRYAKPKLKDLMKESNNIDLHFKRDAQGCTGVHNSSKK